MNVLTMSDLITTNNKIQNGGSANGASSTTATSSEYGEFASLIKDGEAEREHASDSSEHDKSRHQQSSIENGISVLQNSDKSAEQVIQEIKDLTHNRVRDNSRIVSLSVVLQEGGSVASDGDPIIDRSKLSPKASLTDFARLSGHSQDVVSNGTDKKSSSVPTSIPAGALVVDSKSKAELLGKVSGESSQASLDNQLIAKEMAENRPKSTTVASDISGKVPLTPQDEVEQKSESRFKTDAQTKELPTIKVDISDSRSTSSYDGNSTSTVGFLAAQSDLKAETPTPINEKVLKPTKVFINNLKELTKEVSEKLELGDKKELRITVRPNYLGEIKLEVQKSVDGIRLSVVTSSDVVSNLLNQHKSEIMAEANREYSDSSGSWSGGDDGGRESNSSLDEFDLSDSPDESGEEEITIEDVTVINEVS